MSGLFGSSAISNPTQGDISKDVPVKDLPEDSISDIAFSPVQEHLAVASWDNKVRIYEIDGQGNSQGKAMITHEGPVLSCSWSKVSPSTPSIPAILTSCRTALKSLAAEQTSLLACSISNQTKPNQSRCTMLRSNVSRCFKLEATTCW